MPLVSTFEVLLKPQLPATLPPGLTDVKKLSRNVIQGYFLTISNINSVDLVLSLVFTSRLPAGVTLNDVITFTDTSGLNTAAPLTGVGNKYRFSPLFLPTDATALFILQPSPTDTALTKRNLEVRGYVDVQLSSLGGSPPAGSKVLVTAEQRGTFFDDNYKAANILDRALDQIAYGLTVQNGGLLTLN